jgi:hypothetical protein
MRWPLPSNAVLAALCLTIPLSAADPDRDFSGKWVLDLTSSSIQSVGQTEKFLTVSQGDAGILCSTGAVQWSYALDGSETRKRIGEESRISVVKWEGSALLVNTMVSGPKDYTIMDRWALSRDRGALTITRQVIRGGSETEDKLVFRREGSVASERSEPAPRSAAPAGQVPQPALAKRIEPGVPPDVTVPSGTHVLLALVTEVSTKHAKDGDRVYLRTDAPVAVNGHVVIPRGSDVAGTVTKTKKPGRVSGKGELFIRFDSIILPNGVARDFRARPSGEEGKVEGNGKSADGRTVIAGAGMGAAVGAIAKGLPGAGIGGAAGALAGVLLSRDQNVVLHPGTHVDMVLDRDLVFHPDELRGIR